MLAEIFGVDGIIVAVVLVAVLFGSSQIPKLARSLGSAQSEFKKGQSHGAAAAEPPQPPATAPGRLAAHDDATTAVAPVRTPVPAASPALPGALSSPAPPTPTAPPAR